MARIPIMQKSLKVGALYFYDKRYNSLGNTLTLLKEVVSRQETRNRKLENKVFLTIEIPGSNPTALSELGEGNRASCTMMVLEENSFFGNDWVKILASTQNASIVGWIQRVNLLRLIVGKPLYAT